MAGTLTISTLSDGTNSTSSTNLVKAPCVAWGNFDGTVSTPTIRASYNLSSITKTGTGQYTLNLTNALTDVNFACLCTTGVSVSTAYNVGVNWASSTSSAIKVTSANDSASAYADFSTIMFAIHR